MGALAGFAGFLVVTFVVGLFLMVYYTSSLGKGRQAAITIWALGPLVGAVAALVYVGPGALYFWIFVLFYLLPGFGVTVGFHRHFTHPSFRCKQSVRVVLAILGTSAAEGGILEWCAQHRKHHKHTEEEEDPHSPHAYGEGFANVLRGLWHAHIGWMLEGNPADRQKYAPDLLRDPMVCWVDRIWWVILAVRFTLPFGIGYVAGGLSVAVGAFLWGVAAAFFTLHTTFSVNSICHMWGTRPFKAGGLPTNCIWLAPITLGEAFHNAHHAFQASAHHGMTRFEKLLDPSWWVIWTLGKLGLAWNIKEPTLEQLARYRNPEHTSRWT